MESKPETEEAHMEGDGFGSGNTTTPTNETANGTGVVEKDHTAQDSSQLEKGLSGKLSPQHRDFLIARHGTADLIPLPTMDPADPFNWPAWKVVPHYSNLGNKTNSTRKSST
jgi:hypothetical protein